MDLHTPISEAEAHSPQYKLSSRSSSLRVTALALRTFNLCIYVATGIAALVIGAVYSPFNYAEPNTWGLAPTDGKIGKSSDLSYPIFLAGTPCYEADLALCDEAAPTSSTCCEQLFSPTSHGPEESVSTAELAVVSLVVPLIILLVRTCLVGSRRSWFARKAKALVCCHCAPAPVSPDAQPPWHRLTGFSSWDTWLGLLASLALTSLFTELTKIIVGRPRPNFYALVYFSENSVIDQGLVTSATRHANTSWVSGHSSLSIAGILFITLVLWSDVSAWPKRWSGRGCALPLLMSAAYFILLWLPPLAMLVGMSRVRDYWHRPDDVIGGWLVGGLSAVYAWLVVTRMPYRLAHSRDNATADESAPSVAPLHQRGIMDLEAQHGQRPRSVEVP